jgi:hypothetical protein
MDTQSTSATSLSSAEAARILFGPILYPKYVRWQTTINDPDKAHHFVSIEEWQRVRDNVYEVAIGDFSPTRFYRRFMNNIQRGLRRLMNNTHRSLADEDLSQPQNLARSSLSRHVVHPGNDSKKCFVCIMGQHIALIRRTREAFDYIDGSTEDGWEKQHLRRQADALCYHAAEQLSESIRECRMMAVMEHL